MKSLYVNGCSFSCGGGLDIPQIKQLYSEIDIVIENHLDFAWPTLLSKKLKVNLINNSIPGGSINRLVRTTYKHLLDTKFSKDFFYILELPPMWRDELYSSKLNRFVNITHGNLKNPEFDRTEEVNGYSKVDFLKIHTNVINWFDSFVDYDVEATKTLYDLIGLVSLFRTKEVKFLFIENDDFATQFLEKGISFKTIPFDKPFNKCFSTIKDEIGFFDNHMGVNGNVEASEKIYNFLIKNGIFIVK
jgi:hypothetical protein